MEKLPKYQGEFTERLLKRYRNSMDDLICCGFSFEDVENYAYGKFDHPSEIMSLDAARKMAKYYPYDVKEAGDGWTGDNATEKPSEEEQLHRRVVSAFLNTCTTRVDVFREVVEQIGDHSKTINECEIITEARLKNKQYVQHAIETSSLAKGLESCHVILYDSDGTKGGAFYLNVNLSSLLNSLRTICKDGDLIDHTRTGQLAVDILNVMETLGENSHYRKLTRRECKDIYANNKTVPGFVKSLKKTLSAKKISIESELQSDIDNLQRAYECQAQGRKFYTYIPMHGESGDERGKPIVFTEPAEVVVHLLSTKFQHYGIIVGDKKIAEFVKNGGDEILKAQFSPAGQRAVLKQVHSTVDFNRWVFPTAYKTLTRVKSNISRGR